MKSLKVIGLVGMVLMVSFWDLANSIDYGDALSKSILFYEGQRSGKLLRNQRMNWRKDSALKDGSDFNMDLVGGYYDAGDNVKFNFPMAFTITMLAWSVIEFGPLMGQDLQHAQEAIRWGTDYLLKSTNRDEVIVAQVGDPNSDHNCWERPEDMDTLRTTYAINKTHPGSELSGEIAAALASSSLVFNNVDKAYSQILLQRAIKVFQFGDKYQGSYSKSVGAGVCPFYCDVGGYEDELQWGASWLYKATNENEYFNYVYKSSQSSSNSFEFGWDSKDAGIHVLMASMVMKNPSPFVDKADKFVCSLLPESPQKSVSYSKGGFMFKSGGSNSQHLALSFLATVYAKYLKSFNRVAQCGNNIVASPISLTNLAKSQVDYILGNNPMGMSYMVGYTNKYPQKIHHRGSVLPSIQAYPKHLGCHDGDSYFKTDKPNQNVLVGAIVGGPSNNDIYDDNRYNVSQSEPTTYINAPFVGLAAYFK